MCRLQAEPTKATGNQLRLCRIFQGIDLEKKLRSVGKPNCFLKAQVPSASLKISQDCSQGAPGFMVYLAKRGTCLSEFSPV